MVKFKKYITNINYIKLQCYYFSIPTSDPGIIHKLHKKILVFIQKLISCIANSKGEIFKIIIIKKTQKETKANKRNNEPKRSYRENIRERSSTKKWGKRSQTIGGQITRRKKT